MNRLKRREKRLKERDRDKGMDMIMDMDGIHTSGSRRLSGGSGITGVSDDRDGRRGARKNKYKHR